MCNACMVGVCLATTIVIPNHKYARHRNCPRAMWEHRRTCTLLLQRPLSPTHTKLQMQHNHANKIVACLPTIHLHDMSIKYFSSCLQCVDIKFVRIIHPTYVGAVPLHLHRSGFQMLKSSAGKGFRVFRTNTRSQNSTTDDFFSFFGNACSSDDGPVGRGPAEGSTYLQNIRFSAASRRRLCALMASEPCHAYSFAEFARKSFQVKRVCNPNTDRPVCKCTDQFATIQTSLQGN